MIQLVILVGFWLHEQITGRKSETEVASFNINGLLQLVRDNDGAYAGDLLNDPERKIANWAVEQGYLTWSAGNGFGTTDWYELSGK